jgi:type IV pilus assembly protein PilC
MSSFAFPSRSAENRPAKPTRGVETTKPLRIDATIQARTPSAGAGIKIPRKEVIQMSTQLAIMVETGVTISEALECIAQQSANARMKRLVDDITHQVQSGVDLSVALARHPRSFPVLYIALISASEKSGMLPKMLNRATVYLRDEAEIIRKVRGALTYPGIMFAFAICTTLSLLIFVLPRFTALYASKKAALPAPTQVLMILSDLLINNWMIIVPLMLMLIVGIVLSVKHTQSGKKAFHTLQIRLPILGGMFRQLHLARGLRMVGTMAGSGVHLIDCVTTARDLCANQHFKVLWNQVEHQLHHGKQLSEPLFNSPLVPRAVAQMISSAEKSGKLAQVMEQVAGYSEQELKEKISEMTRYIEPTMIVLMGVIIGGVALALMLPIFTISRVMSH